jgi:hypothetical protein
MACKLHGASGKWLLRCPWSYPDACFAFSNCGSLAKRTSMAPSPILVGRRLSPAVPQGNAGFFLSELKWSGLSDQRPRRFIFFEHRENEQVLAAHSRTQHIESPEHTFPDMIEHVEIHAISRR